MTKAAQWLRESNDGFAVLPARSRRPRDKVSPARGDTLGLNRNGPCDQSSASVRLDGSISSSARSCTVAPCHSSPGRSFQSEGTSSFQLYVALASPPEAEREL